MVGQKHDGPMVELIVVGVEYVAAGTQPTGEFSAKRWIPE